MNNIIGDEGYKFSGSELAEEILRGNKGKTKFLVYGDPDIDGMIACYLACRFLDYEGISYEYYVNPNRKHGFYLPYEKVRGYTILAVDFSITDDELNQIVESGASIVVLDHHSIGNKELLYKCNLKNKGLVINNQYVFEDENYRFLSGAGVAYKVLGGINRQLLSEENKAVVGISLLSDIRAIENNMARDILQVTYNSESPLIKRLITVAQNDIDFGFGVMRMDRNFTDYTFSPKFNSLFRANRGFEATDFILGKSLNRNLINDCRQFQNLMIDYIMSNLYGNTNNMICKFIENKPMSEIIEDIRSRASPQDKLILSRNDFSDSLLSNYIGLVCSRLKDESHTAFLCVTENGKIVRGSVRGLLDNVNYLSIFRDFGMEANGHKNAFGVLGSLNVDLNQLDEIVGYVESKAKDSMESRLIEVRNLSTYTMTGNRDIATYNIFARTSKMVGIKYVGNKSSCKMEKCGKMFKWYVDGVAIKCFDEGVTPWNGVILPLRERGYIVFYLKKSLGG